MKELERWIRLINLIIDDPTYQGWEKAEAASLAIVLLDFALLLEAAKGVSASYERYEGTQWTAIEKLDRVLSRCV